VIFENVVCRGEAMLNETDKRFLCVAYDEAKAGYDEGGCPIGSVLARGEVLVSQGRNQRVQGGDPMAGWMHCARPGGKEPTATPRSTPHLAPA
jgi:cytosine/creatinine deaminase